MKNKKYLQILASNNIDALLITNIYDVRYFCNFTGKDSYILFTSKKKYFIVDSRFIEQAQKECKDFQMILNDRKPLSLVKIIENILKQDNCKNIGVDTLYITQKMFDDMSSLLGSTKIVKLEGITKKMRMSKTKEEIRKIKKACEITDRSYYRILEILSEGMSEKDIEIELDYLIKREGGEDYSFEPIISSGSRTSIPYNIPSPNIKIKNGDSILFNYGCKYKKYTSVIARTVVLGSANYEQKKMHEEYLEVHNRLLNSVRDGVSFEDYYSEYLSHIEKSDYKQFYLKSIGNGLGLQNIEGYHITPYAEGKFSNNEVYSIGTSIIVPKIGGVRLEDVVLVKEDGMELLTKSTRDLLQI